MILKYLKIFVLIIFQISLIQSSAFGLNKDDCQNSSFYIKNINVDFTKKSIMPSSPNCEKTENSTSFKFLILFLSLLILSSI